jgi:hypothetical protein
MQTLLRIRGGRGNRTVVQAGSKSSAIPRAAVAMPER